jgi:hypothetical protein
MAAPRPLPPVTERVADASFLGRLIARRPRSPSETPDRPSTIDPAIIESTMRLDGWLSWEMAPFLSAMAYSRKE